MREIKYRCWDAEAEEYLPISDGKCDGVIGISADGVWILWLEDGEITRFENGRSVIAEQYTGLKDKNGKEIAEGDIIVDFDEFISVVDGNCAVISEKTCREKYFDEDDCSLERRTRPLTQVVNDYGYYPEKKETQVEVIGNIHENADLLEEKE